MLQCFSKDNTLYEEDMDGIGIYSHIVSLVRLYWILISNKIICIGFNYGIMCRTELSVY